MGIDMVKIRAKITIGSLSVQTPYIQSFNVSKTRAAISTFSASLKVKNSGIGNSMSGSSVKVYAGEGSANNLIFTGMIKKATISPCWDDPSYVLLNISGEDKLAYLRGKKYTRRCRSTKSSWVNITGVTRRGLKSSKFKPAMGETFNLNSSDLEDSKVIRANAYTIKDKTVSSAPNVNKDAITIPLNVQMNFDEEGTDEESTGDSS